MQDTLNIVLGMHEGELPQMTDLILRVSFQNFGILPLMAFLVIPLYIYVL